MRRATAAVGVALAALPGVAALAWACAGDIPNDSPACTNIPDGGCPSFLGPACGDPTCGTLYSCNGAGVWSFVRACPPRDAGADPSAAADAGADAPGPAPRDAAIDVSGANGGPGCQDLQPPDCPLGFALACAAGSCCGCEDLFVCEDGGWSAWGTCGDAGALVPR